MGPGGKPIEEFLVCPPRPMPDNLGLAAVGVKLIAIDGIYHIFDIVGRKHYPNVADFVEEARLFGVSRRAEGIDYSKLTAASRLLLLHDAAFLMNADDYWPLRDADRWTCPKHKPQHADPNVPPPMCISAWWELLEGGMAVGGEGRTVHRSLPSVVYEGQEAPEGFRPQWRQALFAVFPITSLTVVRDDSQGKHIGAMNRVKKAKGVPSQLVDQ